MVRPVAIPDTFSTDENRNININNAANGLLANDIDPDGGTVDTVISIRDSAGTVTTVVGPATAVTLPSGARVGIRPDGTLGYNLGNAFQSLSRGENAVDFFEYRVQDDENETSDFARVSFNIQGRNDRPVVVDDTAVIDEFGTVRINVLSNDSDVDANDDFDVSFLQFSEFSINGVVQEDTDVTIDANGFPQPQNNLGEPGVPDYTISLSEDGNLVFTPGPGIRNALGAGDVGEITFQYTATDDSGAGNSTSDVADITITINGLDPAPQVLGRPATLFVNPNSNNIVGDGFFEGQDYDAIGRFLFSDKDGTFNPNDIIAGTDGADNIWAGLQGDDTIDAGAGDDIIGISNGTVRAGMGADFVYSTREGGVLDVDLGAGVNNLYSLADESTTISANDGGTFGYSDGDDTLTAGSGNDFVYAIEGEAQGGDKVLNLGQGNNTVFLGNVDSSDIDTGNGVDSVTIGNGRHDINVGGGNDSVVITGNIGDDTVNLGAGNDYFQGAASNDIVSGGSGNDLLLTGGGVDIVNGEGGNDFLFGEGGNDFLFGGDGNDVLYGGAGNNELDGGAGADIFVLERGSGGLQSIVDFDLSIPNGASDRIGLANGVRFEDLRFTQLGTGITGNTDLLISSGGESLGVVRDISAVAATQLQTQRAFYTAV